MNIREHGTYGHGLRPGTRADMNCPNCKREREEGQEPRITREGEHWAGPGFTRLNDESASDDQAQA
jgi:hypothetical protein